MFLVISSKECTLVLQINMKSSNSPLFYTNKPTLNLIYSTHFTLSYQRFLTMHGVKLKRKSICKACEKNGNVKKISYSKNSKVEGQEYLLLFANSLRINVQYFVTFKRMIFKPLIEILVRQIN